MITSKECNICGGHHSVVREHCPFCGARAVFVCSHSYEPLRTRVTYRCYAEPGVQQVELVRAYRSDIAFSITAQ